MPDCPVVQNDLLADFGRIPVNVASKAIIAASFFGLIAFVPSAANAERMTTDGNGLRSLTVSFADLNTTNPEGLRVLERRIDNAANRVCGGHPGRTSVEEHIGFTNCVDTTRDTALLAIERPGIVKVAVVANGGNRHPRSR